ncbi:MAG: hypothetical protein DKT66_06085 [Candidatus Melainabacteria bacterium]|nr:MAG: hypothetical protein DKT66_06085 [Candidatus Melainabacteria bacterium]
MSFDKILGFFKRGAKQKPDEAALPPFEPKYSEGFSAQLQDKQKLLYFCNQARSNRSGEP